MWKTPYLRRLRKTKKQEAKKEVNFGFSQLTFCRYLMGKAWWFSRLQKLGGKGVNPSFGQPAFMFMAQFVCSFLLLFWWLPWWCRNIAYKFCFINVNNVSGHFQSLVLQSCSDVFWNSSGDLSSHLANVDGTTWKGFYPCQLCVGRHLTYADDLRSDVTLFKGLWMVWISFFFSSL